MKHYQCLLIITAISLTLLVGCSGENAKSAAAGVTKKTVEVAKGTITGIDEGIEEGRKAAQSSDGAVIVNTQAEFEKALTVEILSVSPYPDEDGCQIMVGFANAGSNPVRATGLSKGMIILLDSDGYVCDSYHLDDEVTVPSKAKKKLTVAFKCSPQKAGKIRIFGTDYPIPAKVKDTADLNSPPPAPKDALPAGNAQ